MTPLKQLLTYSLDTAQWQYNNGLVRQDDWETYKHAWQTGAPRFEIKLCYCDSCKEGY